MHANSIGLTIHHKRQAIGFHLEPTESCTKIRLGNQGMRSSTRCPDKVLYLQILGAEEGQRRK